MEYSPVSHLEYSGSEAGQRDRLPSRRLYVSHLISTWNSRGFEFGAILFLSTIYPGTLRPMSVYALCRSLAAIALSPAVGRYIDTGDRLSVVRISILGQRVAVAMSCAGFLCLLHLKPTLSTLVETGIFVGLTLMACVEKLCIVLNTISVERDWVVVIAGSNDVLLQEMNSQMRRIDLFCKLVSPLAVALLDAFSSTLAIVTTLALNCTSVIAEYFLIAWVYTKTPDLASPATLTRHHSNTSTDTCHDRAHRHGHHFLHAWLRQAKLYIRSHAFLPSFSLSLLYLTVLSFSGPMITFLFAVASPRLTSIHIGVLRTVATILEISSTFIAPILINRLGAVRAGIWSLSWQFLCLTPGIATFWSPFKAAPSSTYLFIAAVIVSRVGLWSFDLTAQLLVQNSVDANQRGSFSATESSLQNIFELCTFAMTIAWSKPNQFKYPATVSLAAVFLAAACYARFVRVERGHLLHMPPCCESVYRYKTLRPADEGEELVLQHV